MIMILMQLSGRSVGRRVDCALLKIINWFTYDVHIFANYVRYWTATGEEACWLARWLGDRLA